jgi:hypothetical protein
VNCGSWSNFLYISITIYFTRTVYCLAYYHCFPLDTLNPLSIANRWDWQPHRKLGLTNLGFLLRERLATVLIIPSSWGSQLGGYSARIKLFFWRRCRGKRRFLQGEFCTHILYFVLVFLYFIFACIIFIKNTKKIVPFIVVTLLLLVHYVVP